MLLLFLLAQLMVRGCACSPKYQGIRVSALETYAYSATKAGVHHMTKHLANKLASKKITVNAIAAGILVERMN